ncbi:Transmembrane emp24 domain-containing protein p24delta3 [Bienertia sinuspersici]
MNCSPHVCVKRDEGEERVNSECYDIVNEIWVLGLYCVLVCITTSEIGNYVACFWVDHDQQSATLNLDWKIGIAAKDWDSVAKKEHIEGVELELRKLEAAVEAIHENLLYLRNREADMREVSGENQCESCLAKYYVPWHRYCSFTFPGVDLKHYFQKKKLI